MFSMTLIHIVNDFSKQKRSNNIYLEVWTFVYVDYTIDELCRIAIVAAK